MLPIQTGNTKEENSGYVVFVWNINGSAESVFVNPLRSPGIDSQPGGPVRQPYLSYRPATLHRLAESIPRHRFLVSLNVYKYGLGIRFGGGGGALLRPPPAFSKVFWTVSYRRHERSFLLLGYLLCVPNNCYFVSAWNVNRSAEPVFVNLSRSPGIDSQPDGPVRQPYLSYRPARLHRLVESIPRHWFLVSLNVYKYGLGIRFGGRGGGRYSARPQPFLKSSGQLVTDDVNPLSFSSDICFVCPKFKRLFNFLTPHCGEPHLCGQLPNQHTSKPV